MKTLPQPCPSCPWRKDQTAQDIPHFVLDRAEGLASTCPDAKGYGPDFFAPMFACHQSDTDKEFPCAGWLAQVGECHPRVRIAVSQGAIPSERLQPGENWPELHDNYPEVLEKLRATS